MAQSSVMAGITGYKVAAGVPALRAITTGSSRQITSNSSGVELVKGSLSSTAGISD